MREIRTGMEICGEYGSVCIRDGFGRVGGGEVGWKEEERHEERYWHREKGRKNIHHE